MVEYDTWDDERKWGPVALARKFFELYDPDEQGRVRGEIGSIEWTAGNMGITTLTLKFHVKHTDNDFVMDNTKQLKRKEKETQFGTAKQYITSQNFSSIGELGGDAGQFGELIEDAIQKSSKTGGTEVFEFAKLNAESQGSQYLTSYAFEYEMLAEPSPIERASVDDVV